MVFVLRFATNSDRMQFNFKEISCPENIDRKYFTHILECCDNSYYIGSSDNLKNRLKCHREKGASDWTAQRLPLVLIYYETYNTLIEARRRERQLKGWTRKKKEWLINKN